MSIEVIVLNSAGMVKSQVGRQTKFRFKFSFCFVLPKQFKQVI